MIAERYPPDVGGVARSARRIAGALAAQGVSTEVFSWTRTLPAGQLVTSEDGGVTVHRMGLFASWDLSMQHALNVLEWLDGRARFDVLWGHYVYPSGFLAVWFAQQRRRPSIVSARGNDIDQLMFPPGDFARLRWALERATRRVAVSADLARKIAVLLGSDEAIDVVPNAVDPETFAPGAGDDVRARRGIEPGTAVLGFCGELRHKKGAPFLIRALAEVNARRPAVLLVIGEARAREQALLAELIAEQPALAPRLHAIGQLETPVAVAEHLRACDVVLFPSLWEGLPNALLEAMACGVPVIASDAGGMPEVIDGGNGVLVPKAQLHRLGDEVLALLADPERARRLGAEGRATVCARYAAVAEGARLLEVLDRARGT